MGAQGSSQSSSTSESKLSLKQADILGQREDQYQTYFFPEIISSLNEAGGNAVSSELMAGQSAGINQSSNAAKRSYMASVGQRGIGGSGAELQGLANIDNAKGSMLSDAYYKSAQAQRQQKNTLIQMGMQESPKPTSAAPFHSSSSGSGWGFNL